jgi:hypothetical protein
MINTNQKLIEKWAPVLDKEGLPKITDPYRRAATAVLLENQHRSNIEERNGGNQLLMEAEPTNVAGDSSAANSGNVQNWDPVLISLVRRSAPNLIGFDIAGVQPMTGPVGLIFCMKARYVDGSPNSLDTSSTEALFNEADTDFSGTGSHAQDSSSLPSADNVYDSGSPSGWSNSNDSGLDGLNDSFGTGTGLTTGTAENLTRDAVTGASNHLQEMGFTIERTAVTARSRALAATYSVELVQDLRAIHGLDAETELANILTQEILAEVNREVIRTVNMKAKLGAQQSGLTNVANSGPGGVFDLSTDADGRWSVEKYRGMLMQIEREANGIAKETRRGKGNIVLCSSDVASALNAAGILSYNEAAPNALQVDDTGNTYAGMIGNRIKVYVDPYATTDYITIGYRGTSPMDAGLFYCPYVPLTPYRAVDQSSYQPSIAFKTRYGMQANPFAESTPQSGVGTNRSNVYYRIFKVNNILAG